MKKSNPPIRQTERYTATKQQVWDALTNVEEMRQWFFDNIPAFEPIIGFSTQFAVQSGERTFTHRWNVTEVKPTERITYTWNYKEYEGDGYVTFSLKEIGEEVELCLTLVITEDYPSDIPEFERTSCEGGWQYFLGQQLRAYLLEHV